MTPCSTIVVAGFELATPVAAALSGGVGAILGAVVAVLGRNFYSKKESHEVSQDKHTNSKDLLSTQTDLYNAFMKAMYRASKKPMPSRDDVWNFMKAGDAYFQQIRIMSEAVLDDRLSVSTRDRDFVPKIADALERNIPLYYSVCQQLTTKVGIDYQGEFKQRNYQSLFAVVEKHDKATWQKVRNLSSDGERPLS